MVKGFVLVGVGVLCLSATLAAQTTKIKVQVIGSQESAKDALYSVRGYSATHCALKSSAGAMSCAGVVGDPNTFTTVVQGTALSLLLPDGRLVVATCDEKYNYTQWNAGIYRSCRIPCGEITAEFKGENAKLEWTVPHGLAGTKKMNEAYRVVAVLSKIK